MKLGVVRGYLPNGVRGGRGDSLGASPWVITWEKGFPRHYSNLPKSTSHRLRTSYHVYNILSTYMYYIILLL